ncbi:hypothetical protein HH308_07215 [Gordonia sp. TBRC 11910]|uniref:Uncharacterized protein n=1 Tax=Gordonia asplenii TaxID=2725283 RepID=A0A848KX24_9ACTN|nr:hypothetical protein [Gordonia asplenii]NMO01003.1 hypothetical protein [Gordonia asplenii]
MTEQHFCSARCRWRARLHGTAARSSRCCGDRIAPWRQGAASHCPRKAEPLSTVEQLFAGLG